MKCCKYILVNRKFDIIIAILIIGLTSCNSFLDVTPKDQVTDAVLWETAGNADLFLNGIYAQIPGSFNTFDPLDNYSDNSMNGVNGAPSRTPYANSEYTPSNAPTYSAQWETLYAAIRKCNVFIKNVSNSEFTDTSWKAKRLGEARFLRAYFYQLLWLQYGGVPIIVDVLDRHTQGDDIFRNRNTDKETFNFIISELSDIENDLPVDADEGRASRGAALTLEAWCQLYEASPLKNPSNDENKWEAAASTYKKIIDMNYYSLFPDYATLFLEDNNGNNEIIFAKQYLGGTSLGGSREGLQGTWHVGGVQKAWGGVDPTQELVDSYEMANGLPISDPNSGYDPQDPYKNREDRFYATIVYDGSVWDGTTIYTRQGHDNSTDLSNANEATNTGYTLRKGLNTKYAINGNNLQNSANEVIYRYAGVLLGYAEAHNEAVGPDQSVYDAINSVRDRVNLPPLPSGLSQSQMRKEIHRERRVEMAFEGKRLYDLLRWKEAETRLNGPLHAILIKEENGGLSYQIIPAPAGERTFYADRNYLLPIPQSVIDKNPKIKQNPNY